MVFEVLTAVNTSIFWIVMPSGQVGKRKKKLSRYTPWWRLGGEEV
jgi:hypothetical protein